MGEGPYRMEWRYRIAAHKVILLDAGHVCQNLYLACEAIKAGVCRSLCPLIWASLLDGIS